MRLLSIHEQITYEKIGILVFGIQNHTNQSEGLLKLLIDALVIGLVNERSS